MHPMVKGYRQAVNQKEYHNPYSKVTQEKEHQQFLIGRTRGLKELLAMAQAEAYFDLPKEERQYKPPTILERLKLMVKKYNK